MKFWLLNHEATIEDLNKFKFSNKKIGVIAHIENNNGEILLQQRGIKSRDENGLYEYIGGKVDPEDSSFKDAIIREIKEEAGSDLKLEVSDSKGIYHCCKNNVNWIFVIYIVKYIEGEIKIMEPDKCQGYKFCKIDDALNSVNMSEYKNSYTDTLSLGQKQRIAIASTLAINPNLLILDEPTTMLDPINKTAIYKTLNNLHEKSITIIYITNNIDEILLADRILFLENGEIKEDFKKETLLNHLDSLKDFEAPGIISLIKKLSNKQISALNINDLLNIYK